MHVVTSMAQCGLPINTTTRDKNHHRGMISQRILSTLPVVAVDWLGNNIWCSRIAVYLPIAAYKTWLSEWASIHYATVTYNMITIRIMVYDFAITNKIQSKFKTATARLWFSNKENIRCKLVFRIYCFVAIAQISIIFNSEL